MSELNKETLEQLSKLCRINCTDEELNTLVGNLQEILGYIDMMKEVDTEEVPECIHVIENAEPFQREDDPNETLDRETFLKNSPSHVGGMVRVPTVIKF